MGHNKLSCKNPSVQPTPKPKKKIGRPRLNPELTNCTRLRRGGGRGGRSGRRGSTSVYEESEIPTVDSEHVPETQEADVNIDDECDGLDMADLDQILSDLSYLRESKYGEADILLCLNITQSQLKGFDALIHQSKQAAKDVPFVSEHVPETQEDNGEDGAEESHEENDEDGAEES
ncbi:unnamed protein product [Lactuca saligna]|uniref:Uncharacterized protein n=1 Tax=Lactuca saligna TaxID=75948 RepID=A0AA35YBC8_LACSI|nr:unnamed protein product [Lactuca saligna]